MKTITIVFFIMLLSGHSLANEQSIRINKRIANSMFIGAVDTRFNFAKNDENDDPFNYQQLISSHSQQYLWFTKNKNKNKLNLSGISLVSLLNDLGIKRLPYEDIDSLVNISDADQQLSQQLFYIATLFNGYQLKPLENPKEEIIQAVKSQNLATYVDQLLPQFDQVVHLRTAIASYRKLLKNAWPRLDKNLTFKLGQGHQEIVKIRQILTVLGDMDKGSYSLYRQHIFDPEIIIALKKFQARHDLKQNGKLTPQTIAALNITPQKRIKIMQINLWRWLSLPSIPPQRYVMVNIPSYHLSLIENQQESLSMKVIVGDSQHPTPIMVTQVNSLTINPTWTPPYNIIHKELLPENASNPGSLKRQNFKLVKGYGKSRVFQTVFSDSTSIKNALGEYTLVQASGKNNALGKYRFNINNFHSVYLHDTPAKNLFKKANRSLSHGCVRLQSADKLAKHFLDKQDSAKSQQVKNAISSTQTLHFTFAQSIPVYLTYQTVQVTATGGVQWKHDIYQRDERILTQITLNSQSRATVSNVMLAQQ